jgi:hypothetical protein
MTAPQGSATLQKFVLTPYGGERQHRAALSRVGVSPEGAPPDPSSRTGNPRTFRVRSHNLEVNGYEKKI